jgi:hypothetical protein
MRLLFFLLLPHQKPSFTFKKTKMKKTILTLALASAFGIVAAQNLKPAAGTMGFTAGFKGGLLGGVTAGTSPTGSLHFKYYIAEGLAARVGFNVTVPGTNGTTVSDTVSAVGSGGSVTQQTTTIKSGGTRTQISLGIQKSLGGTDKLDVYTGADLFFGGATAMVTDTKIENVRVPASNSGDKLTDYTQMVTTTPGTWKAGGIGGFNMGVNGFVGFQYFIVEKLSLGAEFAYGYVYNSGDNTGGSTVTTGVKNTTTTTTTTNTSDKMHMGTHGLGVAGSTITLSFYW